MMNIPTVEFGQQERTMADSDMFEDWRVVFSLDRGMLCCTLPTALGLKAINVLIKDDDRIGIRNRLEQDMARRAQGGRSTQAATGGQGTRPVRRPRKPVEPPDIGVLEGRCQVMVQRIDNLLKHAVEHPLLDASNIDFYPSRDMIPLIKLTRVFLNKLSRPTNNRPHPLLGMSPENLLAIIRSTVRVPGKVENFSIAWISFTQTAASLIYKKFSIFGCLTTSNQHYQASSQSDCKYTITSRFTSKLSRLASCLGFSSLFIW
ncbi:hypothetical protein KEM48_009108 [Puccinia striiformis f. sp. tritici PST-130]|nr:hypothetical protein KEM48_009108 [Puccinia striiformis f. sp. tritici PST-130]